jgi:hypothetical protein
MLFDTSRKPENTEKTKSEPTTKTAQISKLRGKTMLLGRAFDECMIRTVIFSENTLTPETERSAPEGI